MFWNKDFLSNFFLKEHTDGYNNYERNFRYEWDAMTGEKKLAGGGPDGKGEIASEAQKKLRWA